MDSEKKKWEKPELEMLAQGKPEEAVLEACKGVNIHGAGDGSVPGAYPPPPNQYCVQMQPNGDTLPCNASVST